MDKLPLVSICIVTYKSANTITETLDSVYAQTYPRLELIVSDDFSPDNTVYVVRQWMEAHKERFERMELITVPKNTGVSANYNRASDACLGDWVKDCDGDDLLLPDCVQSNIDFITEHPDVVYVFSKGRCFGIDKEYVKIQASQFDCDFFGWKKQKQLDYLYLCGSPIFSSSAFYNRQKCIELNFNNDERIPNYEDRPKWIRLIEQNIPLAYINKELICYRITGSSISTTIGGSKVFSHSMALFDKYYRIPYIEKAGYKYYAFRHRLVNKKHLTGSLFWKFVCKLADICLGKTPEWTRGFDISFAYWIK